MKKFKFLLSFFILFVLVPASYAGEVVVITNKMNSISQLSDKELSDLYLGRTKQINGNKVELYELPINDEIRGQFFKQINGMSLPQLNAYWARLRFSGRIFPPIALENSTTVIDKVLTNKNAIGYIDSQFVNDSVKVIYK